ncbi:hypothetical protein [Methylomonas sp. UP202]|uniref:hypothetical protein n=1 Tax=Methylomonas sp. UP202 TaxID=3040943 RepID=UPI002478982E|nr:hypothetical protein [Methylomonas sp. UP202]WGS87198.1 hypothetical protein QC632_05465 [Methylomonas sp. UP202]
MKTLSCILILTAVGLWPTADAATLSLSLIPQSATVTVGDTFAADVVAHDLFGDADPGELLLAFGLNLGDLDDERLEWTGVSVNPVFSDDSAAVGLTAAGSTFPGLSADDTPANMTLATLYFRALAAGSAIVGIHGDLADPNQGLIFLNRGPVAIAADFNLSIVAVPLPTGALLFASGMAAMLVRSGRRA